MKRELTSSLFNDIISSSASSVRKEVVSVLYYIFCLIVCVGVDVVLYILYKWLNEE